MDELIQELKNEIKNLKEKNEQHNSEFSDILRFFNLLVIDTKDDLRIINCFGTAEEIFTGGDKIFERGNSLIKAIHKVTRNTNLRPEENIDESRKTQELLDIEETIVKFINSTRTEREFQIIGETENGDVFLLICRIKRTDKYFRTFLKVLPTNTIIKNMQDKHSEEVKRLKKEAVRVYDAIQDGVTLLDLHNKILYMNPAAKKLYFNNSNRITKNANFEGRLFQEIFVNEDPDIIKEIVEFNKNVLISREETSYSKKINEKEVSFHLKPTLNERDFIIGITIISRTAASDFSIDTTKLFTALKNLSIENKNLYSKVKELEGSLQKSNQIGIEFQSTVKLFYSFFERMPCPLSIIRFSSQQYEFINAAFEKKISLSRELIKGKKDSDLYPNHILIHFSQALNSNLSEKRTAVINIESIKCKQTIVYNASNEPTHIIRVFDDNLL